MINLKGKNVLVTGGAGFIGSHLVKRLSEEGAHVVVVDIKIDKKSYFSTEKLDKKAYFVKLNICNFNKLVSLIKKNRIDFIFHLAAQSLVERAYKNPKYTLYNNIIGTINVLEAARNNPRIKGVIVASSDKAYGKTTKDETFKYKESDPLRGDHPYEVSKSSTDLIANSYYKTYNLPVVITRFGNVYGEGDLNFSRIIPGIMKSIVRGEVLGVRSNGKYVRDYLYVKDVVAGYLLLANNIEKVKGEAFNFGSNETLSVLELIKLIEKILKKKIKYEILNTAKNEIPYQSLDWRKINRLLKWKPKYIVRSSLFSIFAWYKKQVILPEQIHHWCKW